MVFDEPLEGYDNVYSMSYSANEGSFLAGMAAASASDTGVIGFIGGADSTVVNDSLVGYLEGAAYVNPDVKAVVSYTGNWDDSAKGKELALAQYNAGADIIFQLASNAGVGVFEAAKETGNWQLVQIQISPRFLKKAIRKKQSNSYKFTKKSRCFIIECL